MNAKARAIKITSPMVLIPIDEYEDLLFEAGHMRTPKLDKEIAKARADFRKGRAIPWAKIKGGL